MLRVRIDGGRSRRSSCGSSAASPPSSPATPPTSPTGRTSSCTGSASRTCPRSGGASRPSACRRPRPAATPRVASSAARSPASPPTRSSTRRRPSHEITERYIGDPDAGEPAAQVQDRHHRAPEPGRRARDQRRLVRRRRAPRARPRLRPVGRRRPLDGAAARPSASASSSRRSEAADVWHGVTAIFRDYGYRRLRNKARLKFLLADWGPEKFRQVLETEYLGYPLPDGPPRRTRHGPGDHVGVHRAEGRQLLRRRRRRSSAASAATLLTGLADLVEANGSDAPCGPRRTRSSSCSTSPRTASTPSSPASTSSGCRPGRARSAAPRSPAPASSSASSRSSRPRRPPRPRDRRAREAARRRRRRSLDAPISLHVNGCPNSCARIQTADIGLKGQLVDVDGEQMPGFQVHLGGGLASHDRDESRASAARSAASRSPPTDLPDYVERVVRRFLAGARATARRSPSGRTAPKRRPCSERTATSTRSP